jgi:hypothetical protein
VIKLGENDEKFFRLVEEEFLATIRTRLCSGDSNSSSHLLTENINVGENPKNFQKKILGTSIGFAIEVISNSSSHLLTKNINVGEKIRTPASKKLLDLKSSPFDHSGTPTYINGIILYFLKLLVKKLTHFFQRF